MRSGPNFIDASSKDHGPPADAPEQVRDHIILVTGKNNLFADKDFLGVFGYNPAEARGKPFSMLVHPDDRERVEEINRKREQGEESACLFDFKGICKDGSPIYVKVSVRTPKHGKGTASVIRLQDVARQEEREEEVGASEEKYRTLFENSPDALYISARDGRIVEVNSAFRDLFGCTGKEAAELSVEGALTADERERFVAAMKRKGCVRNFDVRLARKNGTLMDCLLSVKPTTGKDGEIVGYQGIVRDVTEHKRAQEALQYMAHHDSLTGLPNRVLFKDRLTMAIVNATRNRQRVAVMVLDLDRFKDVNDGFGHEMGDKVLKAVADRLVETVRKGDTVARMGGDEFLLIVPEINTVHDAATVKAKVMGAFRTAFPAGGHAFPITCSAGISIYPENGRSMEILVHRADTAMFRAKREHGNDCQFYDLEGLA